MGKQNEEEEDDKTLAAEETVRAMRTVFLKYGVLDGQNLDALQDFETFEHVIRSYLFTEIVTADQVCKFAQQMLYLHLCDEFTASVGNYNFDLTTLALGILLQSFLRDWHYIPVCPCMKSCYSEDFVCCHMPRKIAVERHFGYLYCQADEFLHRLSKIENQECLCMNHASAPLRGNNMQPAPTYTEIKNLLLADEPWCGTYLIGFTYMVTLQAWILSKVFNYFTPAIKEEILKRHLLTTTYEQRYLTDRYQLQHPHWTNFSIKKAVLKLQDLQTTHCPCFAHSEERTRNLMERLQVDTRLKEDVSNFLESQPAYSTFSVEIDSCYQLHSEKCVSQSYTFLPDEKGDFKLIHEYERPSDSKVTTLPFVDWGTGIFLIRHDVSPNDEDSSCGFLPSDLPDLISNESDSDSSILPICSSSHSDDDSDADSTADERPLGLFRLFLTGEPSTSRPMTSFDLLLRWLVNIPTPTSSDCGNSDFDELD